MSCDAYLRVCKAEPRYPIQRQRLVKSLLQQDPVKAAQLLAEAMEIAMERRPTDAGLYLTRAELHARQSQWQKAADDLAKAQELDPELRSSVWWRGNALLHAKDVEGYRRYCREKAKEVDGLPFSPPSAESVAWLACLHPDAVGDYNKLIALAERAVKETVESNARPGYVNTHGAILYRAGRFREALGPLNERLTLPQDWAFLAMAHHRLGNHDQAKHWLAKLRRYKSPMTFPTPHAFWSDAEVSLFLPEVEAVLGEKREP
jgi:tetratricopeptide (TPR) repeat protein